MMKFIMQAKEKLALAIVGFFQNPVDKKLTVSDLVKKAKINRTTFYRNFQTVEELIRWFAMNQLVFKYEGSPHFNFEYAFIKIFNYIDANHTVFYNLFNSPYQTELISFVVSEIYGYQMMAFPKIDVGQVLSAQEMRAHSKFYAHGIAAMFTEYVLNPTIRQNRKQFTIYLLRIVKEYMERAILRKKSKLYEDLV